VRVDPEIGKVSVDQMITHLECVVVVRVDPEVGEETVDQMITHLECVVVVRVDPEVGEETVDHEINVLLQKGNATREWLVNLAMGQELEVIQY
jgi:hypothetical protein